MPESNLPEPDLLIAILCGGQSLRMGSDKSLLCYRENLPQREFLWRLSSAIVGKERSIFSLNRRQSEDVYYCDKLVVVDETPQLGPMGGIVSVMKAYPSMAVLAIACDMPQLTEECLQNLIRHRQPGKFATVYTASSFLQPLCAIYESIALSQLIKSLECGQRSLQKTLKGQIIEVLHGDMEYGDVKYFANANTRE